MDTVHWQEGSWQWTAMASPISLQLPDLASAYARSLAELVRVDMELTEQSLSRFRTSAELVALNLKLNQWTEVSPRLYRALTGAYRAYRLTQGLFDPRILRDLERYGYVGAAHGVASLDGGVNPSTRWLDRDPAQSAVRIHVPLDLGGIGKGLGARWAARWIARSTDNFLFNAGGDMVASGSGPEGQGWEIGVEDPNDPDELIAAIRLPHGGAVCTSSIARHHWDHRGHTVHHLIDPRTGAPGGAGLLAVTVIGRDPAWSEIWSKVLFLHGADSIQRAAARRPVLWVTTTGRLGMTALARPLVFWHASGSPTPIGHGWPRPTDYPHLEKGD